jgi:hypothetical protein
MMRAAVKDKSYQRTPVGVMVSRYLRWFKNEWGATTTTVRDYEAVLARMSLTLADRELIDVSTEDLRAVIDLWGDQSARTRQKVTSIVRAFWPGARRRGTSPYPPPIASAGHGPSERWPVPCPPAPGRSCSRPPSTRAIGWRCSAC